jgi:hypothetical protein
LKTVFLAAEERTRALGWGEGQAADPEAGPASAPDPAPDAAPAAVPDPGVR